MVKVYFTRLFTSGILQGLTHNDSISYPTVNECVKFINQGKQGFKKCMGGCDYKIIDASFQKYDRS